MNKPEYLWQRLQTLGIPSWRAWQLRAGVSRRVIHKARHNQWQDLKWGEIQRLAASLDWDPQELLGLGAELQALKAEIRQARAAAQQARQAVQRSTFGQLQSLLVSYPTAQALAQRDPTRPAQSVLALLAPLESWLQQQGISRIGEPFQQQPYDPVVHQCSQPVALGDPVEIRFVGYRCGEEIWVPARVIPVGRTVEG
ncbi:MAG: helix-turn-helix transcriptional regulator [Thermostichales cyanobacterium BF4_bins_65]